MSKGTVGVYQNPEFTEDKKGLHIEVRSLETFRFKRIC